MGIGIVIKKADPIMEKLKVDLTDQLELINYIIRAKNIK